MYRYIVFFKYVFIFFKKRVFNPINNNKIQIDNFKKKHMYSLTNVLFNKILDPRWQDA